MNEINWVVWLIAAAGGVIVGVIICVIGMWMDARRAAKAQALDEEFCAMQAQMDEGE